MSEQRDRVREFAEKMFDGDLPAVDWAEGLIREELRELLDAAEALLVEDLCEGRRTIEADGSEPEKHLAAQLKDWRAR